MDNFIFYLTAREYHEFLRIRKGWVRDIRGKNFDDFHFLS